MKFAYADPPYLGCCQLYDHYHQEPWQCWNNPATHRSLIDHLTLTFPDGWALSASMPSLRTLLPMVPKEHRIGVWCKTFVAFKKGVRPAYAWEPIIFCGGRNPGAGFPHPPPVKGGKQTTPKDWVETAGILAPITLKKGLTGAKPEEVCTAILGWLNVEPGDEVVDLFPGTGAMGRAMGLVS